MTEDNLFELSGRLFFTRKHVRALEADLNTAGVNIPADSFAGYASINIIVIGAFITAAIMLTKSATNFLLDLLPKPISTLLFVAPLVFLFSIGVSYLLVTSLVSSYLSMKTEDRKNKLETSLPDFLALVDSNIKAGMPLDQAMWYSAKPEFGLLSVEIRQIIKIAFSGQSLEVSLVALGSRFDSKIFKRTLSLLKQASATGGEVTHVLEKTADDVRNSLIMKKDIAASLIIYEIFVLFAAVVGTPFLFAVATKLIEVFEKITPATNSLSSSGAGGALGSFSGASISGPLIHSSEFFWFAMPVMFVTALVSSFIVSVIRTGSRSQGTKYFPFVLIITYVVYFIVNSLITGLFSSLV